MAKKILTSTPSCKKAPEGWACTRSEGHDGPCAAVPTISIDTTVTPCPICDQLSLSCTTCVGNPAVFDCKNCKRSWTFDQLMVVLHGPPAAEAKKAFQPSADRVLILPEPAKKMVGAIHVPSEPPKGIGHVLAIGPDVKHCKVGDRVAFVWHASYNLQVQGEKTMLIKEEQMLGVYANDKADAEVLPGFEGSQASRHTNKAGEDIIIAREGDAV